MSSRPLSSPPLRLGWRAASGCPASGCPASGWLASGWLASGWLASAPALVSGWGLSLIGDQDRGGFVMDGGRRAEHGLVLDVEVLPAEVNAGRSRRDDGLP